MEFLLTFLWCEWFQNRPKCIVEWSVFRHLSMKLGRWTERWCDLNQKINFPFSIVKMLFEMYFNHCVMSNLCIWFDCCPFGTRSIGRKSAKCDANMRRTGSLQLRLTWSRQSSPWPAVIVLKWNTKECRTRLTLPTTSWNIHTFCTLSLSLAQVIFQCFMYILWMQREYWR